MRERGWGLPGVSDVELRGLETRRQGQTPGNLKENGFHYVQKKVLSRTPVWFPEETPARGKSVGV